MEAEQQQHFISKTFIFQNQTNSDSQNLDTALRSEQKEINIGQIIGIFKSKNSISKHLLFKIYDPEINHYVNLDPTKPISRSFLYSPVIMIKYKEFEHQLDSDKDSVISSKAQSQNKKERNRERTIREVLQYVKQWRQIHSTLDAHKNKVNLQEAAKMVGISKKSLDDYFCQLRLAEQYGFNFEINMEEKIGVLRSFVKKFRHKGFLGGKYERLPKRLRILQWMDIGNPNFQGNSEEKVSDNVEAPESIIQSQYEPPMDVIPENQYENRFYNSFNLTLDDFDDPFMNIANRGSLKNFDNDIEQPLF